MSAPIALALQGLYYLVTGAWPLVSMKTFELVTGPKSEHWLVHTVSFLVMVIGATLLRAASAREDSVSIRGLALGTAVALASMDVFYVSAGRISAVYLGDALAEIAFAAGIVVAIVRGRRKGARPT